MDARTATPKATYVRTSITMGIFYTVLVYGGAMRRRSFLKLLGLTAVPLAAGIPLGREVRGAFMQLLYEGEVMAELPVDFRLNAQMVARLEVVEPINVNQMKLYPAGWTEPISDQRITPLYGAKGDSFTVRWDMKAPEGCSVGQLRPQYHVFSGHKPEGFGRQPGVDDGPIV